MENIDFDWLDGNFALNYASAGCPTSGSPRAGTAAERVAQLSGELALPLLRLSGCESEKQYDKSASTMTFGGISPNVRSLEPGIFIQTQNPISSRP
jgi:hypothetical protein